MHIGCLYSPWRSLFTRCIYDAIYQTSSCPYTYTLQVTQNKYLKRKISPVAVSGHHFLSVLLLFFKALFEQWIGLHQVGIQFIGVFDCSTIWLWNLKAPCRICMSFLASICHGLILFTFSPLLIKFPSNLKCNGQNIGDMGLWSLSALDLILHNLWYLQCSRFKNLMCSPFEHWGHSCVVTTWGSVKPLSAVGGLKILPCQCNSI